MTRIEFRLKELRVANGMTQVELAERAEIDQGRLSRLEGHQGRSIGLDVLARLCDALDCEPGDLLVRIGKKRNRKSRRSTGQ